MFEYSKSAQQRFDNVRKHVIQNLTLSKFDPNIDTPVTTDF